MVFTKGLALTHPHLEKETCNILDTVPEFCFHTTEGCCEGNILIKELCRAMETDIS